MTSFSRFIRNPGLPWLGLILLLILSVSILLPVDPNDYWWYVRLGKDILATGSIPTSDLYSSTQAGQPFLYHSWLSAVIFWLVYQIGGLTLTVLLRAVLLLLFFVMIWHLAQLAGASPRLAVLITLLVAMVGSNHWAMRPQLFSYPLFALTLIALWQWRNGHTRWVWALPAIMVLWVNLHGAYIMLPLLAGAALVGGGGDRKMLAISLFITVLASLLNPNLIGAWTYIGTAVLDPTASSVGIEWQPPIPDTWQNTLLFIWLLAVPILAAYSTHKLSATDWLWFLGIGWMALNGLRYVIWFGVILGILTAALLSEMLKGRFFRSSTSTNPAANLVIFASAVLMPLALLPGLREGWWPDAPPALASNTPVAAAEWLADHPQLAGPMWSDMAFSSYLIYALPERPVWIDTRIELYPPEQWEVYARIARPAYDWQTALDDAGIDLVMVDRHAQAELVTAMQESDMWEIVYEDDVAVILNRGSD